MKTVLLGIVVTICGSGAGCSRSETPSRAVLRVFAASSLTEAFSGLERGFEVKHPVDVRLTFAGSQVLRLQLEQGAGADLFASANAQHMDALVKTGVISHSATFASNELVVIVPSDNPAAVRSFADLPRANRLVVGANNVPVGIYTRQLLDGARSRFGQAFVARARSHIVSKESNVRLVRAKVELGEADAAIVYRTDAVSSDRVRAIAIPAELNIRASYPIGLLSASANRRIAEQFVDYVRSAQGRAILERHGFVTRR